jgi:hypothetical protein
LARNASPFGLLLAFKSLLMLGVQAVECCVKARESKVERVSVLTSLGNDFLRSTGIEG